uniref:Methyltransf_11 domain-containing protein n=1 Tax=Panagrellus redivivus TaxID=6233 RepID=A0A7E4WAN4_PANRE
MFDRSGNDYTSKTYWDSRFETEETFEWVADFKQFSALLTSELKPTDKILQIGCGNSKLCFELANLGFTQLTNVDFSSVLIDKYAVKYPEMAWICDDMRSLEHIPDDSFDVVIEKATIESLLAKEKSVWTFSDSAQADLRSTLAAIRRVLKPGGIFISISFTPPYFRVNYLVEQEWDVDVSEFGDGFHFYCYKMRKGLKPDLDKLERFLRVNKN